MWESVFLVLNNINEGIRGLNRKMQRIAEKRVEIGVPCGDAKERLKDVPICEYAKRIEEISCELANYNRTINKNALTDLKRFTHKSQELRKRLEKVEEEGAAVDNFMKKSEQTKSRHINTKFAEFYQHFTKMFKRLIPAGDAHITVVKKIDADHDGTQNASATTTTQFDESTPHDSSMDDCIGFGIRAKFRQDSDFSRSVEELSGGQRTIVAMAFVLALQRTNPAPFYVFDEVDEALDDEYRNSLVTVIQQISGECQCLATTFRKDLIECADKVIGMTFVDQISQFEYVQKEMALEFIASKDDDDH